MNGYWDDDLDWEYDDRDAGIDPAMPYRWHRDPANAGAAARPARAGAQTSRSGTGPGPGARRVARPRPVAGDEERRMRDRLPPWVRDPSQYGVSEPYGPNGPIVAFRLDRNGSVPTLRALGTPYPDMRPPINRAARVPYRFTPAPYGDGAFLPESDAKRGRLPFTPGGSAPIRLDRPRTFPRNPVMDAVDLALRLRDRLDAARRGPTEHPVDRRGPRKR